MAKFKSLRHGLLAVTSSIDNFVFDEKKFLNGLTERRFKTINAKIKDPLDYFQSPKKFREIIDNLKEQEEEEDKHTDPTFKGAKEDVKFTIRAAFVIYDSVVESLVKRFGSVKLPMGMKGSNYETSFFSVNLGRNSLYTPGDSGAGEKLISNIHRFGLDSPELHKALFRSVHHSEQCLHIRPPAYEIVPKVKKIHQRAWKYSHRESPRIDIEFDHDHENTGLLKLDKLTFKVSAEIEYRFTPCLGGFDDLEKFGLRNYSTIRADKNMME